MKVDQIRTPIKIDWLLLTLVIFIPRLINPGIFLTADEPLFLDHARNFAQGIRSGELTQTLGIGYPGVTVAGWAAPFVAMTQSQIGAYAAGRIVTASITGLLLLAIYALARPLLGRWPAFVGILLLALDPYSLAYSRLLHIAAPLALFMTLAGLSFFLWLSQERRHWLVLTGGFLGLALLTKSTALLLGPMLGAVLVVWGALTRQWSDWRWWLGNLGDSLVIALVAGLLFTLLWPAMWIDPMGTLELTFGKLFRDQEAGTGNLGLFWLGRFVEDPGPFFYPVAFVLKATPWLLLGLMLNLRFLFTPLSRSGPKDPQYHSSSSPFAAPYLTSLFCWVFTLTYLIIMTIASKKSIRYMLPAFPGFYLLAGLALYQTGLNLKEGIKLNPRFGPWVSGLGLTVVVLFSIFYHPYYFTYYNPLFLGWRWAPKTLLVGWGEGLDEAARYLNDQPPQRVSAWYEWLFPLYYFKGEVRAVVPQENMLTADRTVLYINQVQRDIPGPNIIHYFRIRRQPEYVVQLAGIEYAWIYPGPIAGFRPEVRPQYPLGGTFGDEAALLGYDLRPQPVKGGAPLTVTFYWQALMTPETDRFVYVRLVDPEGHIWARTDSPPVMGLWPTSRWQPEMIIEDAHELPIPAGTPPGVYRLEAGLYDPASGQPLATGGQPVGQGGGLLLGEVRVEWESYQQIEINLPHQVEAALASDIHLAGYDLPDTISTRTGEIISIRLAWRDAGSIFSLLSSPVDYQIGFRWNNDDGQRMGQSTPLPIPAGRWGRNAILFSQHDLIVPPELESGRYALELFLHQGDTHPIGELFSLGTIDVIAPVHQFDLPADAVSSLDPNPRLAENVILSGYNIDISDQALDVELYWRAETPLTTRYKVFVQLLNKVDQLMAQSDRVPSDGQRPTTGWVAGEIILDQHTLQLPPDLEPDQVYRLITGLYNPLNGQRLPVLDTVGEISADAIVVTEVRLP